MPNKGMSFVSEAHVSGVGSIIQNLDLPDESTRLAFMELMLFNAVFQLYKEEKQLHTKTIVSECLGVLFVISTFRTTSFFEGWISKEKLGNKENLLMNFQ